MSEERRLIELTEEVFDTSGDAWQRKLCGREKCQRLTLALEEYTGITTGMFGESHIGRIKDHCMENIEILYGALLCEV